MTTTGTNEENLQPQGHRASGAENLAEHLPCAEPWEGALLQSVRQPCVRRETGINWKVGNTRDLSVTIWNSAWKDC